MSKHAIHIAGAIATILGCLWVSQTPPPCRQTEAPAAIDQSGPVNVAGDNNRVEVIEHTVTVPQRFVILDGPCDLRDIRPETLASHAIARVAECQALARELALETEK